MSITSSLQQVAGGIAAVVAGQIVVEMPSGALLHFDTLGYVLVVTTLISLALVYLIDRRLTRAAKPAAGVAEGLAR
jgi:drug/metabolite transporter (DMT)-like permease